MRAPSRRLFLVVAALAGAAGCSSGAPAAPPAVDPSTARFSDTSRPIAERQQELADLATRGDEAATDLLMAVGDERIYLNRVAIEALGRVSKRSRRAAVNDYLTRKLSDPDARVICAAARSLAQQAGAAAVPAIALVIQSNRMRADYHEEIVLSAAVEALDLIRSPDAVPVLAAELARASEMGFSLEYGSRLVAALQHIATAESISAISAYASLLIANAPADPMAHAYYQTKIDEALEAVQ
jgi:hypothetical protein